MKSYAPKILTFTGGKKFDYQAMEDEIASYTIHGWKIIAMTQFQGLQPMYTVLLQYEFSEKEIHQNAEHRA